MSTLVYVHGTNGSGKSTLARAVLEAAGGIREYVRSCEGTKAGTTWTATPGVAMLGKYTDRPCGGVDCIAPYNVVYDELWRQSLYLGNSMFAEGLITPGVETCRRFAVLFDRAVFIHLATPDTECIKNMLRRRAGMGKAHLPYDPKNLYAKTKSAAAWANNLERAGLEVHRLQYKQAYSLTLKALGLKEPSINDLL